MKRARVVTLNAALGPLDYRVPDGIAVGPGSIVAAVECASGKKAEIIGKPNKYSMLLIEKELGLKPSEIMMVGDRLDTDISYAKACKIRSALVLTGNAKKSDIKDIKPDFVFDSVADLEGIFAAARERRPCSITRKTLPAQLSSLQQACSR